MTDSEDNKQIKFIEILLIVGGIIGGLGFKNDDSSIRFILALFLISSLLYYYTVSDQFKFKVVYANLTSILFSVLITYPLILGKPIFFMGTDIHKYAAYIIASGLFYLIFINLQEKSGQVESGKISKTILIIGFILTLMTLNWLDTIPAGG